MQPINLKATSKADVMTALRQSFNFGKAILKLSHSEAPQATIDQRFNPPK